MKEREITTKQIWFGIFLTFLFAAAFMVANSLIFQANKEIVIRVPEQETVATSTKPSELKTVNLIDKSYVAPLDIYTNPASYKKYSVDLALKGEFDSAKLIIKGEVKNSLRNFISLTVDLMSGTLGAERKDAETLDLKNTALVYKKGGFETVVDLLNPVKLSTTRTEYSSTFLSSKSVTIWDYIEPPPDSGTIATIVVAPYSEKGKYGDGTTITSLEFHYSCKSGSFCGAKTCQKDKNYTYGSECIRDSFGTESAEIYSDYFR